MDSMSTQVFPVDARSWAVRVQTGTGVAVEYRYPSERQARFMAAVLSLGPSRLPPAQRLVSTRQRPKKQARHAPALEDVTAREIEEVLSVLELTSTIDDDHLISARSSTAWGEAENAFAEISNA